MASALAAREPAPDTPKWIWVLKESEAALCLRGPDLDGAWLFARSGTHPRELVGATLPPLEYGEVVVQFPVVPGNILLELFADEPPPRYD